MIESLLFGQVDRGPFKIIYYPEFADDGPRDMYYHNTTNISSSNEFYDTSNQKRSYGSDGGWSTLPPEENFNYQVVEKSIARIEFKNFMVNIFNQHTPLFRMYIYSDGKGFNEISGWGTFVGTNLRLKSTTLVKVPNKLWASCTELTNMFKGCTIFNQNIATWDVRNIRDINGMLDGCHEFNQDLSSWNLQLYEDPQMDTWDCPSWTLPKPNFTIIARPQ